MKKRKHASAWTAMLVFAALVITFTAGCDPEVKDELVYPGYQVENRSNFTLELRKNDAAGAVIAVIPAGETLAFTAENRDFINAFPVYVKTVRKNDRDYHVPFVSAVTGANNQVSIRPDYAPETYRFPPETFTAADAFAAVDFCDALVELINNHPSLNAALISGTTRATAVTYQTAEGNKETEKGGGRETYAVPADAAGTEVNLFVGLMPDLKGVYQVLPAARFAPYPTTNSFAAFTDPAVLNGGTTYPKLFGGKVYTLTFIYKGDGLSLFDSWNYQAVLEDTGISFSPTDL